jgi:hypothetical protein
MHQLWFALESPHIMLHQRRRYTLPATLEHNEEGVVGTAAKARKSLHVRRAGQRDACSTREPKG